MTPQKELWQETMQQTQRNTDDIHELTVNVTRLTSLVENSEKRRQEDAVVLRETAAGINKLGERIAGLVSLEKDIHALHQSLSDQRGDIRTLRHDLNNIAQAMNGMPILGEKAAEAARTLATHGAKIEALETWRDQLDGARGTLKWVGRALWAVFGSGILAVGYFILQLFLTGRGGGTGIGGE